MFFCGTTTNEFEITVYCFQKWSFLRVKSSDDTVHGHTQRQISSSFDCVGELTAVYTVRRETPAGNVREPDHQVSDIYTTSQLIWLPVFFHLQIAASKVSPFSALIIVYSGNISSCIK